MQDLPRSGSYITHTWALDKLESLLSSFRDGERRSDGLADLRGVLGILWADTACCTHGLAELAFYGPDARIVLHPLQAYMGRELPAPCSLNQLSLAADGCTPSCAKNCGL